jgi:hypothetical protein
LFNPKSFSCDQGVRSRIATPSLIVRAVLTI